MKKVHLRELLFAIMTIVHITKSLGPDSEEPRPLRMRNKQKPKQKPKNQNKKTFVFQSSDCILVKKGQNRRWSYSESWWADSSSDAKMTQMVKINPCIYLKFRFFLKKTLFNDHHHRMTYSSEFIIAVVMRCTWYADEPGGIEGLVIWCKGGKLRIGRVDGQMGAGALHVAPALFHNPAVLTIRWPARPLRRQTWKNQQHNKTRSQIFEHCNPVDLR